jgi:high mobility group protein 20A
MVAEEWRKLSEEKKKPYLEAAEIDKERYHRECKSHNEEQQAKKTKIETPSDTEKPKLPPTPPSSDTKTPALTNGTKDVPKMLAIPIFTDEFLEHNKQVDTELRNLRKSNTDYEQQNSVLEKHVENMKNGIAKLDIETSVLRTANLTLQNYLDKLRKTLATSQLASLAIPSEPNGANLANIDKYMADLRNMEAKNMESNLGTMNKAKDIIRKLDLAIH